MKTIENDHYQIVVVGAGVSGLAAAKELHDSGHDVVVLEARDRIGGRIWTRRDVADLSLDMGASWIHDVKRNPIYHLARQLKLPLSLTDYDNYKLYYSQMDPVDSKNYNLDTLERRIYRAIESAGNGSIEEALASLSTVLITVPLGVLQRKSIEFIPQLPEKKQVAIQALGMGVLNKLYLQFPESFWEEDTEVFGFISGQKGQWGEWYNLQPSTRKPILLGFVAGSYAEQMEERTDDEIVEDGMRVLRNMFGQDIPDPSDYYLTRWKADPFAGGSYSYLKVGAKTSMRRTLAAPVDHRVFFAGEATSSDYPATVHGAYLSGLREAEKIQTRIK